MNDSPPAVATEKTRALDLASVLLPTEKLTHASRIHPIILLRPIATLAIALGILGSVLLTQLHPIVRGHHVALPLYRTWFGAIVVVFVVLVVCSAGARLYRAVSLRIATHVVATNRRVFLVSGLFTRRVVPIPTRTLYNATLEQGLLGRRFDYGTIRLRDGRAIADAEQPVALYHALQAVANGVIDDNWTPPTRIMRVD